MDNHEVVEIAHSINENDLLDKLINDLNAANLTRWAITKLVNGLIEDAEKELKDKYVLKSKQLLDILEPLHNRISDYIKHS